MILKNYFQTCLPAIESELQAAINRTDGPPLVEYRHMLAYHMGWEGPGAGPDTRGKRIRPMLVLLSNMAAGGDWQMALPAASAVELIHNFSLIHDDIEDQSPYRRGRLTVWKKWNIAQATNAGDAMFTLAHLEIFRLINSLTSELVIRAARLLHQTCLQLTQGQFLDLVYENRLDLAEADYWTMIGGKTAALLATCTELGALVAKATETTCEAYRRFGFSLGLAFQAQDDLLGIWGDMALTGKSNASDLTVGKKSLPVIFGLNRRGLFYQRYTQGPIPPEEVPALAQLLADEGAKEYTQAQTDRLTDQAIQSLEAAHPQGEASDALIELTNLLLRRQF